VNHDARRGRGKSDQPPNEQADTSLSCSGVPKNLRMARAMTSFGSRGCSSSSCSLSSSEPSPGPARCASTLATSHAGAAGGALGIVPSTSAGTWASELGGSGCSGGGADITGCSEGGGKGDCSDWDCGSGCSESDGGCDDDACRSWACSATSAVDSLCFSEPCASTWSAVVLTFDAGPAAEASEPARWSEAACCGERNGSGGGVLATGDPGACEGNNNGCAASLCMGPAGGEAEATEVAKRGGGGGGSALAMAGGWEGPSRRCE